MQKARTFLILGVWVAILPYLGFPSTWKNILFTLTGLIIIALSYTSYKEQKAKEGAGAEAYDNFKENNFDRAKRISEVKIGEEYPRSSHN